METKTKQRLLILGSLLMAISFAPTEAQAFDPKPELLGSSNYDIVDVASWDQMGIYGQVPKSKTGQLYWADGCMTMSYATFMRKTGQRDKNWGPHDAYDELNKAGMYPDGQFPVPFYQPGQKWGDWEMVGFESGGFEALKAAYEEGYGIVCWIDMPTGGNHVFTVDSIEGDTLKHLDSGRAGTSIDDPGQWGKGSITGFYKLKSPDGTKFKNLAKLNEVRDGSNSKGEVSSEGGKNTTASLGDIGGELPAEEELIGMKKRNFLLKDYQVKITLPGHQGEDGNLNVNQQFALNSIKEDSGNKKSAIEWIRISVSVVGIIFSIYGILFLLAYIFDRNNILFEYSLLSMLTFGFYATASSNETVETENKTYIGTVRAIKLIFLIQMIAYILYGGLAYKIISTIIGFLSKLTGG